MAIQVRRGPYDKFDPHKMLPGEWAVSIDNNTKKQVVWMCFAAGVVKRMGTYEDFKEQISEIAGDIIAQYTGEFDEIEQTIKQLAETTQEKADYVIQITSDITEVYLPQMRKYAEQAEQSVNDADESALNASNKAKDASDFATKAESWAHGGTNTRLGEDSDNAKEYARQAKESADRAESVSNIGYATIDKPGISKPDGVTTFVDEDGTMHAVGSGGGTGTSNYPDLNNLPQINGVTLKGDKTLHDIGAQPEGDYATNESLKEYTLIENAGAELVLKVNPKTYLMELELKNANGNIISSQNFDFPIETAFTNVYYDKSTHEITFTLQNGTETEPIDISDIVRGLVPDDRTIAGLNLKSNITAEQLKNVLGFGNVDNTADKDKSVKYAESAGTSDSASKVANALTFTGGASGSYDGSKPLEVEIPKASVDILSDKEQVEANTEAGKYVADALVTKDMIINAPEWIFNEDGSIKAYKTKAGADTEFPFSHSHHCSSIVK